jgi:DNA-binding CsgD family transcriptional regulator
MAMLPRAHSDVAAEVTRIAASAGRMDQRAEALVESLHRAIRFDAAWIGLLNPERRGHVLVLDRGYDQRVRESLDRPQVLEEIEEVGLHRWQRAPLRVSDALGALGISLSWEEYLRPAGFRDGMGVGLFHPDGRYLGVLGLHAETATQLTDDDLALLALLTPTIAAAVDPMRSLGVVAGMVAEARAGTVLTRSGDPLPLPGLPSHFLLRPGSLLLSAAAWELDEHPHTSFLCPYRQRDTDDRQVKVTVLSCPPDLPKYLVALVLISPAVDVYGLTPRELEILGLLVEGWPNGRIAAALFVTSRTVATHVEHILAKLAVPSRSAAAVFALRLGLYIPRVLAVRADEA